MHLLLVQGEQPPGIQDIDDKPPNPDQAISEPKMKPRPKPWERTAQVGAPSSHVMALCTCLHLY